MKSSSTFLKWLVIISITLVGVAIMAETWWPLTFKLAHLMFIIGFFFAITLTVHLIMLKASQGEAQKFVRYFMLATFLKLMAYFVFIFIFVFLNREYAVPLLISFLILYFFYTAFEVVMLRKHLDSPKAKTQ